MMSLPHTALHTPVQAPHHSTTDSSTNSSTIAKISTSLVVPSELFGGGFDFVIEEDCAPHDNMQRDHERAAACCTNAAKPLLRLYSWHPWAVSLGAHQREYDIDAEACKRKGFELVRRPTGGRAVLHANELTYCIVAPLATAAQSNRTIHDMYRDIHILLLEALHSLGATTAIFEKTQANLRLHYRNSVESMVCFSSSARYEIVWHDPSDAQPHHAKKLVGSAQKLYTLSNAPHRAVVLQHGSILLGAGHEQLADVARVMDDAERAGIRRSLLEKSATLEDVCGRPVSFDECAAAIERVFTRVNV